MKFILNSGGVGDALIGCAEAYKHDKCCIIHAANRGNRELIAEFYDSFGLPSLVLNGTFGAELRPQWETLSHHPDCLSICHLPENMNHAEWGSDPRKYANRVCNTLDVQGIFGADEFTNDQKPVIVAPTGSQMPRKLGAYIKDRSITREELARVVARNVQGGPVYIVASEEQAEYYGIIPHANVFYLSSDGIIDWQDNFHPHGWRDMFRIINSARIVLSVDTWVKTYAAYARVPTIVFKTKYHKPEGGYAYFHNRGVDTSDAIFLNRKVWGFNLATIEEYLGE